VACYPVVTFGPFGHEGTMQNLLGEPVDPNLREYLSLEDRVTPATPPTFIWHTAEDVCVSEENVLLLASALSCHHVPHALHLFTRGHHGLGLAQGMPETGAWTQLCGQWLVEMGFVAENR